jgi:hypothetical protein
MHSLNNQNKIIHFENTHFSTTVNIYFVFKIMFMLTYSPLRLNGLRTTGAWLKCEKKAFGECRLDITANRAL